MSRGPILFSIFLRRAGSSDTGIVPFFLLHFFLPRLSLNCSRHQRWPTQPSQDFWATLLLGVAAQEEYTQREISVNH